MDTTLLDRRLDYRVHVQVPYGYTTDLKGDVVAKPGDLDLSAGGAGFASDTEYPVGASLRLIMVLPPQRLIETIVRVAWHAPAPGGGHYIGTRFAYLSRPDHNYLIRYLYTAQLKSLQRDLPPASSPKS